MAETTTEGGIILPDENWKDKATEERDALSEELEAPKEAKVPELPPVTPMTLVAELITSALLYMGKVPDPVNGSTTISIPMAEYRVEMLHLFMAIMAESQAGHASMCGVTQDLIDQATAGVEEVEEELKKARARVVERELAEKEKTGVKPS